MNKRKLTGDDFEMYADGSTVTIVIDQFGEDSFRCIVDCYEAEKIKAKLHNTLNSATIYEKNREFDRLCQELFDVQDKLKQLEKLTNELPSLISTEEHYKKQIEKVEKDLEKLGG